MSLVNAKLSKTTVEKLKRIRSAKAIKIFNDLLFTTTISEEDIKKEYQLNDKNLRKVLGELVCNDLVIRWKQEGIFYTISKDVVNLENTCLDCEYRVKELKNVKSKNVRIIGCKLKKDSKMECMYNYSRVIYNCLTYIEENADIAELVEEYDRGFAKQKEKTINEWGLKEFCKLYIGCFKQKYPEMISPVEIEVRKVMLKILNIFNENFDKVVWRRLCKCYIIETVKNGKPSMYDILNTAKIGVFGRKHGSKIASVEFCEIKNVYCSYCKKSACTLDGIECSDVIVNKMMEKYN